MYNAMNTDKALSKDDLHIISASEMFVQAAEELLVEIEVEQCAYLDDDKKAKLRSEIIRHYEVATHGTVQTAMSAGMYRQAHEIAPEKIESVNSYMRGWLRHNIEPNEPN